MPGASPWQRVQRLLWMSRYGEANNVAMFRARCERGAAIVRKIGMGEAVAGAIYALDEHWNGAGFPQHLQGEQIPMLSRVLAVAQHLDVFAGTQGRKRAIGTLRARSGTWFDPEVVSCAAALDRDGQLWIGTDSREDLARVIDMEPGSARMVGSLEIDGICEAFAEVVDAKSPMTYRHSVGVMEAANAITGELRLPVAQRQLVHRAALLHDIGKLRVPNSILDKRGELTLEEWAIVREHPLLSEHILARVPSFDVLASIAGHHHERLDGSGYPYGLSEAELTLEDRIVAAADVYGTLAEERPYRAAMPPREIEAIFRRLVRQHKLDPMCCEALGAVALQAAERSEEEALQLRAGWRFPQDDGPHGVLEQPGAAPVV
jgi:putative nucleotidyltransferase with HDIG domain